MVQKSYTDRGFRLLNKKDEDKIKILQIEFDGYRSYAASEALAKYFRANEDNLGDLFSSEVLKKGFRDGIDVKDIEVVVECLQNRKTR